MSAVRERGDVIAGRYKIESILGEGGMGEVWRASQLATRKPVALKFIRGEAAKREDIRHRLLREARAAAAVRHPNVVEIHDVLEDEGGAPVLVMELLEGVPLSEALSQRGHLSVSDTCAIISRVVSAVGTAHAAGIVHRDLKPENIFLAETATGTEVKVVDFGIAKRISTDEDEAATAGLTKTGALLGTPYYMAPEQAFGEKDVDHRADVWALGVILYRCLSGHLPTAGENLGQVLKKLMANDIPKLHDAAPHVPQPVCELVDAMLTVDRAQRIDDLARVREVLSAHGGSDSVTFGPPATARTISEAPSLPTAQASRKSVWLAGGVAAVVVVAMLATFRPGFSESAVETEGEPAESGETSEPSGEIEGEATVAPEAAPDDSVDPEAARTADAPSAASAVASVWGSPPHNPPTQPGVPVGTKPTAEGASTAPPAESAAPPASAPLPGGVVEKLPF